MTATLQPFAADRHGLAHAAWERALAYVPCLPDAAEIASMRRQQQEIAAAYRAGTADRWPRDARLQRCFPSDLMVQLAGVRNEGLLRALEAVQNPDALAWIGVMALDGRPWRAPVPRDVREGLLAIERHAGALGALLQDVPEWHMRRVLPASELVPLAEDPARDVMLWREAILTLAEQAGSAARKRPAARAGRKESPVRDLAAELAQFWIDATDEPPTVHLPDLDEGGHPSPFAAFVHGFVGHCGAVLWAADPHRDSSFLQQLEARGLAKTPSERLLRSVCREVTELRSRKAN